ncbi:MAG: cystathionine beta-lyase [Betaproteobacteria bacterium]|nr:cystathionine beta-lyase [Betaproteobacteria bacterium]
MKKDTQLVHFGRKADSAPKTVSVPLHRASTVVFDSVRHQHEAQRQLDNDEATSTYGLFNLPQVRALEDAVAKIEGGFRAATFPSGLAAVAAAILACVKAGDHLLITDSVYHPTRHLAESFFKRLGIATTYYDPLIGERIADLIQPNTAAVYCESPGSHTFEIQDLPAIARAAHAQGAKVILDNAWATGYFFDGFAHGADLVVQPATKYYGGHSDVIIGLVVANEAMWPALKAINYDLGQRASPDDCFLTLRGLRTLGVRLQRHQQSALTIAQWLQTRPEVARVFYPPLPDDPGHALWKRDFTGAGGLVAIELNETHEERVAAMQDGYDLFKIGYSWGGFESLVVRAHLERSVNPLPARPLVRFQIGLEDPEDLIVDLARGFERLARI